jgi:ABC-type transport system involved in multi-copper enzyme maturation permease subunit
MEEGKIPAGDESMSTKTPSTISSVLTVILLILFGLVLTFGQVVMLNGFSEREGNASFVTAFVCQGVGILLCAILAWWLTKFLVQRFNWSKVLSVIISTLIATALGGGLAFVSLIVSLGVADAMWKAR